MWGSLRLAPTRNQIVFSKKRIKQLQLETTKKTEPNKTCCYLLLLPELLIIPRQVTPILHSNLFMSSMLLAATKTVTTTSKISMVYVSFIITQFDYHIIWQSYYLLLYWMDSGTALRVGLQLDTVSGVCSYVPSYEWDYYTDYGHSIQVHNLFVYLCLAQT